MFGKEFFKKHTFLLVLLIIVIGVSSSVITSIMQERFREPIENYYGVEAICKFVVSIIPLFLMVKWGYLKKVKISKVLLGFVLGAFTFIFFMPNILILTMVYESFFNVNYNGVIAVALASLGIGLIEESAIRGVLLPFLCEKWHNKKHVYVKATIVSSVLFAVMHLSGSIGYFVKYKTLPMEYFLSNMYQVYYTFCYGIFMAAIVIKTKNIWGAVFWHGVCDFVAFLRSVVIDEIFLTYIYGRDNLTFARFLEKHEIMAGFKYASQVIEGCINLTLVVVGLVIIIKEEKKLEERSNEKVNSSSN